MRVAVIGCGGVAWERHLPVLRALPGVTLSAVADIDTTRAEAAAREFGAARAFTDYRALLAESDADVVAVCLPARDHRAAGTAVMAAGKHLFIEKPLALTREDARALVDCADRQPVRATVGFNLRSHRLVRQARGVIQSGQLGRLEVGRSTLTSGVHFSPKTPAWRKDRGHGGGAFFEMAVHHFDAWRFLLGAEIVDVRALATTGEWMDDAAALCARFSNGVLATLVLSQSTRAVNELELFGQKAQLRLDCYRFDGLEAVATSVYPGNLAYRASQAVASVGALFRSWPTIRAGGDWADSYRAEWRHFLHAISTGEPVAATLEDGARAVEAALRAMESLPQ